MTSQPFRKIAAGLFVPILAVSLGQISASSTALADTQTSSAVTTPNKEIAKVIGLSLFDIAKSVGGDKELRQKLRVAITTKDETEAFSRIHEQLRDRDDICAIPGAKRLHCDKDMSKERDSIHLILSARQQSIDKPNAGDKEANTTFLWFLYTSQAKAERLVFEPWIKAWEKKCANAKMRFDSSCLNEKKSYGKTLDAFNSLTSTYETAVKQGHATLPGIEENYEAYRD